MAKIRYLGHSAFYVEGKGLKGLIDPFLSGNPNAAAAPTDFKELNAVFVTHGHGDHVGDAVEIARRTGAAVYTCNEMASWFASMGLKTEGMHVGGRARFSFGTLKLTPAWHGSAIDVKGSALRGYGGVACGFVIEVDGKKLYHAGDTGLTMEMKLLEAERIDVACLPIGGYYTMDAADAARALSFIRPIKAVPMHFNTFPQIAADPRDLVKAADALKIGTTVITLSPGESLEF